MRIKCIYLFMVIILLNAQVVLAGTTFTGIVKPLHEVELAFPLDGIVANIYVKEGDKISKGDRLIALDDSLQKLEKARREAVYKDRAEITANRKNLEIVKNLYESAKELHQKSASVSRDEVQNLEMQLYSLTGRIDVAEAKKQQELLEYEISAEMLLRYTLNAPLSGAVVSIKREPGEWAKTGETILMAADTSHCIAEFNIDERFARNLRAGRIISFKVEEGAQLTAHQGKISYVAPVADRASSLVKVKVEFDNSSGRVVPGVHAHIEFR